MLNPPLIEKFYELVSEIETLRKRVEELEKHVAGKDVACAH